MKVTHLTLSPNTGKIIINGGVLSPAGRKGGWQKRENRKGGRGCTRNRPVSLTEGRGRTAQTDRKNDGQKL